MESMIGSILYWRKHTQRRYCNLSRSTYPVVRQLALRFHISLAYQHAMLLRMWRGQWQGQTIESSKFLSLQNKGALPKPCDCLEPHSRLETAGVDPSGVAAWGWEKPRGGWSEPEYGRWTGLGRCRASQPPHLRSSRHSRHLPSARRARRSASRSSPARSPRVVSLTHGLGHLQLLVEPLTQDLRHGSAWAWDSKQGNQANGVASSSCQGQPVAKEAYLGQS